MSKYEVRLYYKGRADWDTEFFDANCNIEARNKGIEIAKKMHADHHSVGQPTPQDDYRHSGPLPKRAPAGLGTNPKDQIAAVEGFLGAEVKPKKMPSKGHHD